MIGAIVGDIIGSVYEYSPIKTKDFPLFSSKCIFTDDTVLTVAIADAILAGDSYEVSIRKISKWHPDAGYGLSFLSWLNSDAPKPYDSYGNGSAMRASPIGFAFDTESEVFEEAKKSAELSHNHPEGIRGAQAVALSVFYARNGYSKNEIKTKISEQLGYDLERTVDDIRPNYSFNISCQGTVPEAIISFLDSTSYEDAIRNAVSLGGDSDTLACITGGIAEAFYGGVPMDIQNEAYGYLTYDLQRIVKSFYKKYIN